MGGGLLQLVAYGAQDVYLTGNPQITFFKVVYRRHTNFAMESIEQSFNGNNNFGSSVSVLITRNGDLINRIYFNGKIKNKATATTTTTGGALESVSINSGGGGSGFSDGDINVEGGTGGVITITVTSGEITNVVVKSGGSGYDSGTVTITSPTEGGTDASIAITATQKTTTTTEPSINLVPYFGQRLLKTIELEIGGQRIDKHYSEWLYVWNELSMTAGKKAGYHAMVGGNSTNSPVALAGQKSYEVYVPLEFWFCRNVGLALPLIALQYHEVKLNMTYASKNEMVVASDDAAHLELHDVGLWVDYIFLDTDERRRFAQLSHEYLIEQLQFNGADSIDASSTGAMKSVRMTFNHPCKELIWFVHPEKTDDNTIPHWNNFSKSTNNSYSDATNPVAMAKIQLNGNDRFAEREGTYFSYVQPYQHHECTPDKYHPGINVYSFALKPEEHQPSGTLNMSRIDTAILSMSSTVTGNVSVFSVNYNVLRILSGMGGLAYSN
jgi:hypothetical protein